MGTFIINLQEQSSKKELNKEKLLKRKEALLKFNKNVGKQIRINRRREIKSLEYSMFHVKH